MRITVVLEDLNDTGANRVSLDRAARWQAAGDEVTVLVVSHGDVRSPVPLPAGLCIRHGTDQPRQLRQALPSALWKLGRLARKSDVVVAGTEVGFGLLLAWGVARLARRPFAVTIQSRADLAITGYVQRWLQPLTRAALTHVDLAVCVSNGLVPVLLDLGLPQDRAVVVTNAVSLREIRQAAAESPVPPLAGGAPIVVATGRLTHQKGFDLLLRAHRLAVEQGAPAHRLIILGEGDQYGSLLQLARQLGVEASVSLPGFRANPHAVVSRASLFVLSSRWEGFSLALAEALACGTACLAFDCVAGPSDVLGGGAYGELVEAGDVAALARASRPTWSIQPRSTTRHSERRPRDWTSSIRTERRANTGPPLPRSSRPRCPARVGSHQPSRRPVGPPGRSCCRSAPDPGQHG